MLSGDELLAIADDDGKEKENRIRVLVFGLLAMCVMPTAILRWNSRIHNKLYGMRFIVAAVFTAFIVIGRRLSGVHWVTDIIGVGLLSSGLVLLCYAVCKSNK